MTQRNDQQHNQRNYSGGQTGDSHSSNRPMQAFQQGGGQQGGNYGADTDYRGSAAVYGQAGEYGGRSNSAGNYAGASQRGYIGSEDLGDWRGDDAYPGGGAYGARNGQSDQRDRYEQNYSARGYNARGNDRNDYGQRGNADHLRDVGGSRGDANAFQDYGSRNLYGGEQDGSYAYGQQNGRDANQARGNQFRDAPQGRAQGDQRAFDPDYHQWREEQLRNLDDDYHAWRGERYKNFSSEFNEWRKNRPAKSAADNASGKSSHADSNGNNASGSSTSPTSSASKSK